MASSVSDHCKQALKLLARSKNVLISGAPGTGKSTLLAEIAAAFLAPPPSPPSSSQPPRHDPSNSVVIPRAVKPVTAAEPLFPGGGKLNRKVFRTVFHQNSKYRDFVSGITPSVKKSAGSPDFTIVKGTLYRASEQAKNKDGAALLIIDEINRGPAVQVFGGAIVAIESDKRLAADGSVRLQTQYFELLDPNTGDVIEYALPHDLYIVAAMNQADASVEPLDVAFLRRWEPLRLEPNENVLRKHYGLGANTGHVLPAMPVTVTDVLEASVRAWLAVNEQIALGRGPEFQIGHGVLMADVEFQALSLPEVLNTLCVGWAKVRAHVEEVFFGDHRGVAAALNALDGTGDNPFKLDEREFAGDLRFRLEGPLSFSKANIYPALRSFARV